MDNLTNNPEYDKIFLDKNSFFEMIPPEKLIQELTGTTVQLAQRGVDAASIVFAHSIVDAAAFDYCRVTALVAPGDWESIVDQRQIKLSDLRGTSYDQILRQELDEFFEQLERESLLKKVTIFSPDVSPRRTGVRCTTTSLTEIG